MSEKQIIDWKRGKEIYYGDEDMLIDMIRSFDESSFKYQYDDLHQSIMKMDYDKIYGFACTVKGSTNFIAADRVSPIASAIQTFASQNQSATDILEHYLLFLHESKLLEEEIAKILKRQVDLSRIERYEKEVIEKYNLKPNTHMSGHVDFSNNPNSPSCSVGCTIF